MNTRKVVVITGEKQKGIRDKIADLAKKLGIKGEIYYLAKSHKIKVILEGKEEKINEVVGEIVNWMKECPKGTKIEMMEVETELFKGNFSRFSIIIPPERDGPGS
ncbi:MAG: hypothetical protein A2175_02060 [Candidatus Nealsonbacteria bacterium RBG_13_42_11]|uniref:Acylphosphatase-like domain-containing protein n=1 Tax=Candidatus Nealsonbacteria bacterium RBG_13_42_11 TaxID=1801663 RepID=A0A1G2DZS9_9BACT|nr:MAG: hypothetical protein A2175_02060 [Candidatus Nealsonbacteria bacterium RBG_13_42_11]